MLRIVMVRGGQLGTKKITMPIRISFRIKYIWGLQQTIMTFVSFKFEEMEQYLKKMDKSAGGIDMVTYSMLKTIPGLP